MDNIRIQNLRSIVDSDFIELNDLNIFLGANSTGKSSILRFFALIKQTISKKNNEPILWYDFQGVDFGSFEESVNSENKQKGITFSFSFTLYSDQSSFPGKDYFLYNSFRNNYAKNLDIKNSEFFYGRGIFFSEKKIVENKTDISFNIKENSFNSINIGIKNCHIGFDFENDKVKINGIEYNVPEIGVMMEDSNLIPTITYKKNETKIISNYLADQFTDLLFSGINENVATSTKWEILKRIEFESDEQQFINKYIMRNKNPKTLKDKFRDKSKQRDLYNFYCGLHVLEFIEDINRYIFNYFSEVTYIAPVRASAERYYRIQGLSLDEVDSMGANVPMMIYSMKDTPQYNEWNNWTQENFGIEYTVKQSDGHSAIFVKTENGIFNLADTGFGYSQLLPVLLVLWKEEFSQEHVKKKKIPRYLDEAVPQNIPKTIIVEQPELHLHPAMQSRIADLLMKMISYKGNINFIIETHSVAIINRIGEIIEDQNFDEKKKGTKGLEKKVNIFLVNPPINENSNIVKTDYDEEGVIREWPVGFLSGGIL